MLQGVDATIGNPVSETGRVLNQQVDPAMPFAGNPMLGIAKIREMFDQTFRAMDVMDIFRAQAIDIMGQYKAPGAAAGYGALPFHAREWRPQAGCGRSGLRDVLEAMRKCKGAVPDGVIEQGLDSSGTGSAQAFEIGARPFGQAARKALTPPRQRCRAAMNDLAVMPMEAEAVQAGEQATPGSLIAADGVWHPPRNNTFDGTHHGMAQGGPMLGRMMVVSKGDVRDHPCRPLHGQRRPSGHHA